MAMTNLICNIQGLFVLLLIQSLAREQNIEKSIVI